MAKMKAIQTSKPGVLELVEKDIPQPLTNQVRIKIAACGICHSDIMTKEAQWPGIQLPRVPGHEVAGIIDEIGPDVTHWKKGQRVGVGWAGQYCRQCKACRHGEFVNCENHKITGIHYDGGYAQYMIAPVEALAAIPDELSFADAAPLMCAGITTFNALRNSVAKPGDLVAIQGIGGLGHLAVQFAVKMGFKTVAISKGKDKENLAFKLGAHYYLNTDNNDVAEQLQKLGGAKVILATAPSGKSISQLTNGLGLNGEIVVVGASNDPIEVSAIQLIMNQKSIHGWASGSAVDSEETLNFCVLTGVRPMIEKFPLENAVEALDHTLTNKVRFRSVLVCE